MTERYASTLRYIAERAGLPSVRALAAAPGTQAVYRVTVHRDRMSAVDTIITLRRSRTDPVVLEIVYVGLFNNRPLHRAMTDSQVDAFVHALTDLHFDQMIDQDTIPFYGVDLWLVERAAGSFKRDVLLAPQSAGGVHLALYETVRWHLPEVDRELSE